MRVSIAALVLLALCAIAGRARAQNHNQTAAELRRQGLTLYEDGKYEQAAARFEASYELDPRAELLFAWAQAERLSGDCASAAKLYEQFLASGPRPKQRKVATALLALCRETLNAERGGSEPDRRDDSEEVDEDDAVATPERDTVAGSGGGSWTRDWIGHGLAGGGAIALGVGIGFIVVSSSTARDAASAPSYPEYGSRLDRAKVYRALGIGGCAVGGALIVTAIVHYARFAPTDDTAITASFGDDRLGLAVVGRF